MTRLALIYGFDHLLQSHASLRCANMAQLDHANRYQMRIIKRQLGKFSGTGYPDNFWSRRK